MKKLLLSAVSLAVASQVSAAPHLQGYYQAKELVGYTVNKIQQNKAEYFMLDYALTQPAQSQAQLVSYNAALGHFQSKNSGVDEEQFKRIIQKVNPAGLQDQYVCRADVSGVKLAYVAERDEACSSNYDSKPMAISQKGNKVTFFRRWDFDPTQSHFDIQSYDNGADAETLTLDYVLKYDGRWIGDSVRVVKGKTQLDNSSEIATYDVAQYQYTGPRSGIITGYESLLYTEQPYFITENTELKAVDGSAKHIVHSVFNTFGLMDGKYRGRNVDTNGPVYWINRDYVKQYELESGKKAYYVSDPQNFVIETSMAGPSDSWVWTNSDWLTYSFNNTHNLNGLSPTFCMIEDITKDRPVTAYYTADGKGSWMRSMNDCTGTVPAKYVAKVYSHFTNGNGEEVAVSTLKQSAKDFMYVRNQHPHGAEKYLVMDDVKAMQSSQRYKQLKAELGKRLTWSKPYDILK